MPAALHLKLGIDSFVTLIHHPNAVTEQVTLLVGTVGVWDSRIAVVDDDVTFKQLRADARYALQWRLGTLRNLTKPRSITRHIWRCLFSSAETVDYRFCRSASTSTRKSFG